MLLIVKTKSQEADPTAVEVRFTYTLPPMACITRSNPELMRSLRTRALNHMVSGLSLGVASFHLNTFNFEAVQSQAKLTLG